MIKHTCENQDNLLNIKELCALAGVARSGYYRFLSEGAAFSDREERDLESFRQILDAYQFRGYDKGVWGIHMRLLRMGIRMNHKKIRRLMRKYGLNCPIRKANPYRRMAKAMHTNAIADNNVKREFRKHGARRILLTDITYIPVGDAYCYLSVITDAYTKQVLAYQFSTSLEVDFVLETVKLLLKNHGLSLSAETMIHSDQGFHYTSISFRKLILDAGIRQSMSRRGNCWDNAPQESFFGHMKDELRVKSIKWTTPQEAKAAIDDWMDYYNNDRYQMGLEKLSPNEYYNYITTGIYPVFHVKNEDTLK